MRRLILCALLTACVPETTRDPGCAHGAGFDLYDGHTARGAFGVFACVAFAIVASVKR